MFLESAIDDAHIFSGPYLMALHIQTLSIQSRFILVFQLLFIVVVILKVP